MTTTLPTTDRAACRALRVDAFARLDGRALAYVWEDIASELRSGGAFDRLASAYVALDVTDWPWPDELVEPVDRDVEADGGWYVARHLRDEIVQGRRIMFYELMEN